MILPWTRSGEFIPSLFLSFCCRHGFTSFIRARVSTEKWAAFTKDFRLTENLIDTADALKFQRLGHAHPKLNAPGVIDELKKEVTAMFPFKVDKQQRVLSLIEIWETKVRPMVYP